ncbi:MAG: exonuclease SbcCD subunit D C-terminal domain-containing protein [Eubacteriales bacterium]
MRFAPLKYSFDEEHHKKSLTLLDITKQSNTITLLPISTLRDMRTVTGTLEELITLGKTTPSEDYLAVELTNDTPVYMPLNNFAPIFPMCFPYIAIGCTQNYQGTKMLRQTIQKPHHQ